MTTEPAGDPRAMRALAITAAGGALVLAGIGFTGSYTAVRQLAVDKHFGTFSDVFPIGVDAGIIVLLALDLILSHRRMPLPPLRWIAWGLTAATIAFNAASGKGPIAADPLAAGMHAVIPVLFIASAEAARHFVARLAAITAGKTVENPPLIRWFVAPVSTAYIWRRMKKWNVLTYEAAIRHQKEVKIYRARLRGKYKRVGRATAAELLVLELAGYGMSISDAIALPQEEQRKRTEAEAKDRAEAARAAEAEAEAEHQAELRKAEAEAKQRAEIAIAEAAQEAAEAAAEAARVEAKLRTEVATAEAEAKLKVARITGEAAEAEAKLRAAAAAEEIRLAALAAEAEAESKRRKSKIEAAAAEAESRLKLQVQRSQFDREQRLLTEQDEAQRRTRQRAEAESEAALRETERKRKEAEAKAEAEARAEADRKREAQRKADEALAGAQALRERASASTGTSGPASALGPAPITDRRSKRQTEIDEVLALIVQAGDPKSVALSWVEQRFGLTQTTAYDRLSTAQKIWKDSQEAAS